MVESASLLQQTPTDGRLGGSSLYIIKSIKMNSTAYICLFSLFKAMMLQASLLRDKHI